MDILHKTIYWWNKQHTNNGYALFNKNKIDFEIKNQFTKNEESSFSLKFINTKTLRNRFWENKIFNLIPSLNTEGLFDFLFLCLL